MNPDQIATIATLAIRRAADEMGVTRKQCHRPELADKLGHQAQALAMRYMRDEGLLMDEIGEAFGISRDTIRKKLKRTARA